jgi:hypothetical protein
MKMSLETNAADYLLVTGVWLVFQEVVFKQRKIWRNSKEGLIEVNKNGDLED